MTNRATTDRAHADQGESKAQRRLAAQATWTDERYHLAGGMRRQINKVFPHHWSFLLGEMALYSFIILLLSGVYLSFFFDPSMAEVTYDGVYGPLRGVEMSRAYETALNISFDVRGGLFMRQIHHWAALLFLAAMVVHLLRIFFTGAFRKPREANWVIGSLLLVLGIVEGFAGYSLPDDLLSGTGLRIAGAIMLSIPVIGTWVQWLVFDGEFPGTIIIDRFYIAHVLLIPGILLALIAAHLALVWYQKHTQFPGVGASEKNVVGVRIVPLFALSGGGWFGIVFGVLAGMGGLLQINPIWNLGPYDPSQVSAGSQPDWYMGFTDGAARVFPPWEIYLGSYTIPQPFFVALLLGVVLGLMFAYPWIERRLAHPDNLPHNLLQRPRDAPVRTALGAMAVAFYVVLLLSGANDIIALKFDMSINALIWAGRIGLLVVPPVAYWITYRYCVGLQRSDLEVLQHGVETGIIRRDTNGAFVEVHQPLGEVDRSGHPVPLEYQGAPVPKRMNKLGMAGVPVPGTLFTPDPTDEQDQVMHSERASRREEQEELSGIPEAGGGRPSEPRE
ncbi:cytochrome bc complex cytochrome b subunit [Rhodococcus sp. X156]|uniref:cytochrome bc1 complex cytochrome b subunit n=1 Tax=Rhodococcus sp. X156 TaxID=2499145 RepID=UPI000FD8E286|nr:cytochrome bc complex cytochrome b subunit [Rhodococcus sp. X156]